MLKDTRKIAAIVAADVVEYSRLMGADEAAALATLKLRRSTFSEQVTAFDGREFGCVGDSLMAEFGSTVNAVLCAQTIQDKVAEQNRELPADRRMHLRMGVNLGDVIEEHGDAFGEAVNVAARLQSHAQPGGIVVSGAVYDQVHVRVSAQFIDLGTRELRNIIEPVRMFELLPAESGTRFRTLGAFLSSRRFRHGIYAVLVLAAAGSLGIFWRDISAPPASERAGVPYSIGVLPFANLSGERRNDYLGEGLAEELSHRLTRIPELRVAARTSAFAFKARNLDVREIADRLGVAYLVEGSIRRDADRVRVTAALVDAASGSNRWSNAYERPAADLLVIESDIATQVITALGLVLRERARPTAVQPGGGSVFAYDLYLQGLDHLRQAKSARTLEAAERLFRRALTEQPDFARAQAGLCETCVERYALDRLAEHVTAAEEACANAEALDSSAHEVHLAVGKLRLVRGNASQAEAAYRRALELAPQSPDALIGLAEALAGSGRLEQAEDTYRRAITTQSRYAATHLQYGNFLFTQGRAGDAAAAYERAVELAPDSASALSNLGGAYLLMGNFDAAADAFARSLALEPRRATYANTASVQYYRGRFGEAVAMYRKALELAPADHRLWGNVADALWFDSRREDARESYRRALELVDAELIVNPTHAVNHAQAAYYATRLGDQNRARRSIRMALSEEEKNVYVHYYVALAELGLGDVAKSLMHARRARELGYAENLMRAAPELGEIRKML